MADIDIFDRVAGLLKGSVPFALATVMETEGSVSARNGSRAIISASGQVLAGWIGGGCAESAVCQAALDSLADGTCRVIDLDLDEEVLGTGMPCGGSMRVHVEPMLPRPALWILGHGRIAECLCRIGAMTGFRVVVIDSAATPDRYLDAGKLIVDDYDYTALEPLSSDYVVIATQHKGDHQSMKHVLSRDAGYIALIASRKRTGLVMDYLRGEGFDAERLARVHAPCGLDLGCRTPEEIALSVLAEIVMLRRGGSGLPMRQIAAPAAVQREKVA